MRRLVPLVAAAALLAAPSRAPARAADLAVGDVRVALHREGALLREQPKALAKLAGRIPYGTSAKVVEVREMWALVAVGPDPAKKGWVRTLDLAEPGTLSGGSSAAVATVVASDVTAASRQLTPDELAAARAEKLKHWTAGRQFDLKTEATWSSMSPELARAYEAVDRIEATKPSDAELEAFVREGRLGGTATEGTPNGQGAYSKLKFLGATGNLEGVSVFQDQFTPLPPAASDEDFVRQLGVGFTPEHEYWMGRAVAAAAIAEHGLDPDAARQAMVRRVGGAIVGLSDRLRSTHGGYHFAVLDTDTPNGVAGPGGFVLVTRGALRLARNEDEVAAVLAHELGHVQYKHGEQMVRKTREFQESMKALEQRLITRRPGDNCNLCQEMAQTLGAASRALAKTLNVEGYGRDLELEADWAGSLYLCEVGYRASAIAEYLEMLPEREGARWTTHPESAARIEALRPLVFKHACPFEDDEGAKARLPRFRAFAKGAAAR